MAEQYDLIVLGSGPGGYVAAIRAAQLGLKTAIVERENLGGICLNWGCIPTKALLRSAEVLHNMRHAAAYGLAADNIRADLDAVVKRSRGVAKQLNQGVTHLMKKNKIAVHMGEGVLKGGGKLEVRGDKGTETLSAKHIIIATGARARDLPFAPADGKRIWTYRHAMTPSEMPGKLLVIGSGAIGIEFASFYNDMGSEVTVVEMMDRIVPVEDADVSAFLEKALKKQGMTILTGAGVESLASGPNGVKARIKDKDGKVSESEFSHVIVAVGIMPNTENIGIEALGIKSERGFIQIDGLGRTNVPGIWAIGDVTPGPWLAHKASHEGVIAAEAIAHALGNKVVHPHAMDKRNIPGCTYCRPQVASVGLTEAKAKEAGYTVKAGTFPFIGNGKAIALGEPEGFIKTVFDAKTGELLGAHMVGTEVTELIQGYVVGKTLETTEAELMATVFPHPTLSEMMHESVLAAFERALHI
ncbi:dihydrolipoamide dehydrogenase [Sphingobium wenxiniae]|uniref:Dihydrolipoyl dehydrogenase n=1 Tax=Sphingobium wenxiniae (strain DSM 21828 / CGMCC 1.7748 / JZ-1) TaxID=595605 RepID=A0A562K9W7_SPHWJ|nr:MULTISPECIES: dihydrolipoyl dehydrogenase [Sphingomonadaceae]SCW92442.1 dihydrolipoamide dehydrogenase [Sphingobium faniae]MBB6192599.1 dihydrolipoamide dehydrogenase [Sphingobium wenxiniae]QSR20527.1 dihydrolipoyl dehydrogenase [Novosphingobium sp. KA1]TWH92230.1 dihydrolipoamide dehydrogenase [Sphingobium wenxiniae]BAF03341.1 dihydrolipoamide dehydrogenase [Novosphingobium sp. KA1]